MGSAVQPYRAEYSSIHPHHDQRMRTFANSWTVSDSDALRAAFDACEKGDVVAIFHLLDRFRGHGNLGNARGQNFLHVAIQHQQVDVVLFLLARGFDPLSRDTQRETSVHTLALCRPSEEFVGICLPWLRSAINTRDCRSETPLHKAVRRFDRAHPHRNLNVITMLLHLGVDLYAQDADGDTALHYAVNAGHYDVVRRLIQADGSKTKKLTRTATRVKQWTPLHTASSCVKNSPLNGDRQKCFMLLLLSSFNMDAPDATGITALQLSGFGGARVVVSAGILRAQMCMHSCGL